MAKMKLGDKVICTIHAGNSISYIRGLDSCTVEAGTIGIISEVHQRIPARGKEFPAIPEWYSISINGVQCVAIFEDDAYWKMV